MDNTICVLCKNFNSLSALCWAKAFFFDLHPIQKVSFNSSLVIIFAMPPQAGIVRTLVLFFLSKLCLELSCAKSCWDMEQLRGEVRGLSGSYAHHFREVIIHGYFV